MCSAFVDAVAAVLATTSTDPGLLTLEVTESVLVRDEARALIIMTELKDMGVRLALDDFGTGYSSLAYLDEFPIDELKVDQTFIAKLSKPWAEPTVLAAIIQIAHSLGLTVVSEGVETASQHQALSTLGSDSCQGFYFARPMPTTSLHALISHQSARSDPHLPTLASISS